MPVRRDVSRARRNLRMLMLVPYPTIQGPLPKIVPLLVDQFRTLGCDVETECWSRHSEQETLRDKAVGRAADLWRIFARLRRGRFDVLFITTAHNRGGVMRDVPLVLLTKLVCRHLVIQFHGSCSERLSAPGGSLFKFASRVLVGACDATLVLSRQEQAEWTAFYPAGRFELVALPFAPERAHDAVAPPLGNASAASASSRPRYRSASPTLLFVGRIMPEKGILDLIQALARVNATTACRLLVAGDGPSTSAVVRLAGALGVASSVELLGYLSGPDLAHCYQQADALVLPSYSEGFPTVILEAMSAGLPIVTTALRGAVDRLEEDVNALFVPPGRPDLLAGALAHVLTDDRLRASMSAENIAKVLEFAPERVAPQYVDILRSVVFGDCGGASPRVAQRGAS